jgi:peptidyl-prolyl cis-trans isomerase D
MAPKDRYDPDFGNAAWALRVGQLSQPVRSSYGYHLIKVDARKGDSADVRHILIPIQQSDSNAAATDLRADSLSALAAQQTDPAQFDTAAKVLGLTPFRTYAFENRPLMAMGDYVPSVSAWAFSGVQPGEVSELFDSENGYYIARLDTLQVGGAPTLAEATTTIRQRLAREKKVEKLVPDARALANAAAGTSLEQAARTKGVQVTKSETFNRLAFVPGLGQGNEAIGAAFAIPVGSISEPVRTPDAVYVLRVDRRVNADRSKWEAQRQVQRQLLGQSLRQQRVQQYLQDLRASAEVEDYRKQIEAAQRRAAAAV